MAERRRVWSDNEREFRFIVGKQSFFLRDSTYSEWVILQWQSTFHLSVIFVHRVNTRRQGHCGCCPVSNVHTTLAYTTRMPTYRLQHCLEWVLWECIRANSPRQCCNLFISWLWTQPVIVVPIMARPWDDQSTVHIDWQLGGYQFRACAKFEGLTEFCFVFRFNLAPLCWISRRESSGCKFAIAAQMYEVF